jgi:hypothetical protein
MAARGADPLAASRERRMERGRHALGTPLGMQLVRPPSTT